MKEVWRVVPSCDGLMASSLGRIMITPYINKGGQGQKQYGGTPTMGQWTGSRYIYPRRGFKTLKVARLVCEAFHGPAPKNKPVCMHLDENARNNRPENLAWGTQKENLNAPRFIEYCKSRIGERNPAVKGRMKSLQI